MDAANKQLTNSSAPVARRRCLRWLALPLVVLALLPAEAFAQLGGLGGGGPIGGVGGSVGGIVGGGVGGIGGGSNIGVPGTGGVPSATGSGSQIIGPAFNIPIGGPALPRTDSITNTINNSSSNALSVPGRAANRLGNTVNQAARNATGTPNARPRSGVPPVGERRFVPDEVMVRLPSNLSAAALDALAQRHGLTRLESERIALTGTTFHRWRISGGRSVSDIIRALEAETGVSAAQPNYRFTLVEQSRSPKRER